MPEGDPFATQFNRRRFLALAGLSGGAALLGACSGEDEPAQVAPAPSEATAPSSAPSESQAESQATSSPEVPDPTRLDSDNEIVRGIGGMEERAGRKIFDGLMTFFEVPADQKALTDAMSWHPAALQQTEAAGLGNVVILEPADPSLTNLEVAQTRTDIYFAEMKKQGVTDKQLGRVVVAPEPIVGGLAGSTAGTFIESVNMYRSSLAEHFPEAESTILIDTAPEERTVLVEALRSKKLDTPLETVGVQAYGNAARIPFDAEGKPDISRYLTVDAVLEIAEAAGTDRVWINTGIPRKDINSYSRGDYTVDQRTAIANAVADVVQQVQNRGLTVDNLVLFAENKLHKPEDDPEGRDFSFHPGDEEALVTFADRLKALGVPLIGFDVA